MREGDLGRHISPLFSFSGTAAAAPTKTNCQRSANICVAINRRKLLCLCVACVCVDTRLRNHAKRVVRGNKRNKKERKKVTNAIRIRYLYATTASLVEGDRQEITGTNPTNQFAMQMTARTQLIGNNNQIASRKKER